MFVLTVTSVTRFHEIILQVELRYYHRLCAHCQAIQKVQLQ